MSYILYGKQFDGKLNEICPVPLLPLIGDELPWLELLALHLRELFSTNSSNIGVRGNDSESLLDDVEPLKIKSRYNVL